MSNTITVNGKRYRQLYASEARTLGYRREVLFVCVDPRSKEPNSLAIKRVFVSGACKEWKREPNRFRVPVKFGLYESNALVPSRYCPTLAAFENAPDSTLPVIEVA